MRFKPYNYQEKTIEWILEHKKCGCLLDMGLGKTICTLTAIEELIYQRFEINKVLIIAPMRVATMTWPHEINLWDEIAHLRYSVVVGTQEERLRALNTEADIYIINRENVVWLIDNHDWDFDMCVIDELSSFKNNQAKRFKALKKYIGRCRRVVGLTGTPAPNGLMDLWPQIYLLDQGERLGKTISKYHNRYFKPGHQSGYIVYDYIPLDGAEEDIYDSLADICISMTKEDYLNMPDRNYMDYLVKLPEKILKQYKKFEKESIMELSQQEMLVANNAAAVCNKLQQMANGSIYTEDRAVVHIHDCKIVALEDLIEQANGQPVIVVYAFKHDREKIKNHFKTHEIETEADIAKWNKGEIPILLAHPASIGHGLNLQYGGRTIIWYGNTWSLELYQQLNDRLYRHGQKGVVSVYHIVAKGTVDERIVKALKNKENGQKALIEYMKEKVKEKNQ